MENKQSKAIRLERKSLSAQVAEHIKRMILSEELGCGESIPEEKIGQLFGVSRTPIREALRMLSQQGLVTINPHSQATVVTLEAEEAKHIGEVRLHLELAATRLLTGQLTQNDYAELLRLANECHAAAAEGNIALTFEKDSLFHTEIAHRSGNPYLHRFISTIDVRIQLLRTIKCVDIEVIRDDVGAHFAILEAMKSGDPDIAAVRMQRHIESFIEHQGHPAASITPVR